MTTALRFETRVLSGRRIEISAPELPEGAAVEVLVMLPEKPSPLYPSALDFLQSLPPGPKALPTWEEYEQRLEEERRAWDH